MKSISCKEAVRFIIQHEERKLSLLQRVSLWRHLAVCSLCRIFADQNGAINHALKHRATRGFTLSAEEKEEIIRNVLDEREK
jgi:hypothetical protein